MRIFVVSCAALFVMLASLAPTHAAVQIVIDKAVQSMTVSVDGKRRYSWPVSTGMKGYSTPVGSFQPFRTEEEHYSKEWDDAPMPHSIFFTREGHAIHGSYATRRLGSPASHGCVRLAPAKAATLFSLVRSHGLNNTRIIVSGGGVGCHWRTLCAACPGDRISGPRRSASTSHCSLSGDSASSRSNRRILN